MAEDNEWAYYFASLRGHFGPIKESDPQTGYYRHHTDNPVAIWREDGSVLMLLGDDEVTDQIDQGRIWLACHKKPVTHDHYVLKTTTGLWPGLPESLKGKAVAAAEAAPASVKDAAATPTATAAPGHNSGDPDSFEAMRAELTEEVSESRAFFAKNKIEFKDDADRAQDWGDRIAKRAKEADTKRLAATETLRKEIEDINAAWNAFIKPAVSQAVELHNLAQQWGRAEAKRIRDELDAERLKKWEAEQAEARKQAEERKRLAEEEAAKSGGTPPDDLGFDLPPAAPPPPPPPQPMPRVMVGTGAHGNRRSAKLSAPKVAVITDLKAAALYLVAQNHPDLIALVQKLANAAAKTNTPFDGIKLEEAA